MMTLQLSENITRLRREKNVTQEQLAAFVGVTKGAVSKWENGTTLPDIGTLPLLATFFDVSVDALLGYVPQLSKEEIGRLYQAFAEDFAHTPFDEVWQRVQAYTKRYYSCAPFLYRMCLLLLNHYGLAAEEKRPEVLAEMAALLVHVQESAEDSALAEDARVLQAMVQLQLGQAEAAISVLEPMADPYRLSKNSAAILVSAYHMQGDMEKADTTTQAEMLQALAGLVGMAGSFIMLHAAEPVRVKETVARMKVVSEAFDLVHILPNAMAQFFYLAAIALSQGGEKRAAIAELESYVSAIEVLFASQDWLPVYEDAFFDRAREWQEGMKAEGDVPRDRETVRQDVLSGFAAPFSALADDADFKRLAAKLKAVTA